MIKSFLFSFLHSSVTCIDLGLSTETEYSGCVCTFLQIDNRGSLVYRNRLWYDGPGPRGVASDFLSFEILVFGRFSLKLLSITWPAFFVALFGMHTSYCGGNNTRREINSLLGLLWKVQACLGLGTLLFSLRYKIFLAHREGDWHEWMVCKVLRS